MADSSGPTGRTEKVRKARAIARQALGRPPDADSYDGLPPGRRRLDRERVTRVPAGETMGVLSLGEAAEKLGLSRAQLVAMADAGEVQTVEVGAFGARFVPWSDVERLRK